MSTHINRRQLVQAGAVGAGAIALGSSAIRSAAAQEGGTLRVYWNAGHNYEPYQGVIDQFETDNPGWEVNLELFQWPDLRTKLLADFAAGNPPDLCEEPGGWAQEFGLAGTLLSLDDYIAVDGAEMGFPDDWQEVTIDRHIVDGVTYGLQLHLTCNLLFYNRAMLSEAGFSDPPATWDEFLEVAKATAKGPVFGFAPNQDSGYSWPWFLQNGARYLRP